MSYFRIFLPFVACLLALGIIKIFVGLSRHHPVGFLTILVFLTVLGAAFLIRLPVRTQAGKEALRSHRVANDRASRAPRDHELLLAVALSGTAVLSGTAYAAVFPAPNGGGGGGCGSGGGCGGGGGGCGGCS